MASDARLTIVDLVKSLSTLHTDAILHLVKEVVKKPHQIKGEQVHKHTYMREKTCTLEDYKSNCAFCFHIVLSPSEIQPGGCSHVAVQLRLHPEVCRKL